MGNKKDMIQHIKTTDSFKLKPVSACVRMAIAGSVFMGAVSPVCAELPVPAQDFVKSGNATNEIVGNSLNINQTTDRAILNWQSFNVGTENKVQFNQPSSSSIALNRIFQEDPSRILGKVTANGQIYLYNNNGFVFGKDSTVDVNTLVATTLNISDTVFENGIVTAFDDNDSGTAALQGKASDPATAAIQVDAGAKIHVGENGRLIMAAPNVTNAGTLTADKQGQIILVASKDKVYLQPASSDSPFAGLLVEVGSGGKVTNMGEVMTRQGNVTLAGFAVNQDGRISATTSVNVNGSIRLLAREGGERQNNLLVATKTDRRKDSGDGLGTESKVVFGKDSLTTIVADAEGGNAIDEQKQPVSYVEVSANTAQLTSGSAIVAPGGTVDITATNDLLIPETGSKGRIIMESGSRIDVSGTQNVTVPIERNVVEVSVQSFELRDSPLQKGGVLQGQTVRVDVRKNTTIIDASGAVARFERSIGERLGTGGNINLTSSGDVIVNSNATVDVAGGSVKYEDGYINTTQLVTDYGTLVDISDANPNEHYTSIYGVVADVREKWGVTRVCSFQECSGFVKTVDTAAVSALYAQYDKSLGHFEQGYIEGKNAGNLNIIAPQLSWSGDLIAGSKKGIYQRTSDTIAFGGSFNYDAAIFNSTQGVVFQTEKSALDIASTDPFPKDDNNQPVDLILSTDFTNKSGVEKISIKTFGNVSVASDAKISMAPTSELDIEAGNIVFSGSVYSAGGTVNLASKNNAFLDNSGQLELASGSAIDVSGRWVNDFEKGLGFTPTEALAIDGGAVKLSSTGDLQLNSGSSIKANGGAWLATDTNLTEGKGGSISLAAVGNGSAPSLLHLDGRLAAYGLSQGGSLSLSSGKIVVGEASGATEAGVAPLVLGVSDGHFDFAPELGFSEITLTSNFDDLVVKENTTLDLLASNRVLQENFMYHASSNSLSDLTDIETLPEHLRSPVDLNLVSVRNVKLETNSQILGDKEAAVSLSTTQGGIYVDGLISTPAGSIDLTIQADSGVEYNSAQAIWLGQNGRLSALGTTRMNPVDGLGRRSGDVLDGGNVTLNAARGYVVLEQGSQIDVSGTHAELDLPVANSSSTSILYAPTTVGSNAGKISLTSAEGTVLDGNLQGKAGSATTRDGRIDLKLDRLARNEPADPVTPFPKNPMTINVMQAEQTILDGQAHFGDVIPGNLNGQMTVSADKIAAGHFSDVRLSASNDKVRFLGDVNLTTKARIDIDSAKVSWAGLNDSPTGTVSLTTPYLRMGSSLVREVTGGPEQGGGLFTANAQWMELGGASTWSGFNQISLNSAHDLRAVGIQVNSSQRDYLGELVTAANLNLNASQIYPSTLSNFTFAVKNNPDGEITISGNNTDSTPLSAAGVLNIEAPVINQNGVLKAPFGTINLTASSSLTLGQDSLTSVSGNGQLIPFGITQGGLDWLYPLDSIHNLVFDNPPEKRLLLSAPQVSLAKGSVVDLSGGGDLLAYEFLPGAGGSYDYLATDSPSYQGGFAVVPTLGSSIAPFDHLQSTGFNYAVGSSVYLSGTADLPAGTYTILPARYALLPGAFLVTPQANTQDQITTTYTKDNLPIVAGYQTQAGTSIKDARQSGFLIESGADIRKHSEYSEQTANSFYAQRAIDKEINAPILPKDSGQITLSAKDKLILNGQFKTSSKDGRGARMDIAANRLKIVKTLSATPPAGVLEITASSLSDLHVDSLLLGGTRTNDIVTGATDLAVKASYVVFDTDAKLKVTDLIATATEQVKVKSGASLIASGQVKTGDSAFNIIGDGALLRISGDKQVVLHRTLAPGKTGELLVEQGATIGASESMLLDASKSTILTGDIVMDGGSLNLSANAINIGEVGGLSGDALNLSNQKLINLAVNELVLNSRDTINFYGDVGQTASNGDLEALKFDNLVMNAAGFLGFGDAKQLVKLQVNNLQLQNTLGLVATNQGSGLGQLDIQASNYVQGNGSFSVNGFNAMNLNVTEGLTGEGAAELKIGADLNVSAGYVTVNGGDKFSIDASGHHVQMEGNNSTANPISANFGGTMDIAANAINFNARALLPSGTMNLHALKGDVQVGAKADIDLAGRADVFADTVDYTPGGIFSAVADKGKIVLAEGSKLNLSTGGGDAKGGQLILKTPQQSVELLGEISATAGRAVFDVADFSPNAGFDDLMNALTTAKVTDEIYLRARETDIVQGAGGNVQANLLTLVADNGNIDIAGTLSADAADKGGSIKVYAGDKVSLENGGGVTAKGIGGTAKGGDVTLSSVDADADGKSGIDLRAGSLIDVAGATEKSGGTVVLRALRTDTNKDGVDDSVKVEPIAGAVRGYAQSAAIFDGNGKLTARGYSNFYVEGVKKYTDFAVSGEINAVDIAKIKQDTTTYMQQAAIKSIDKNAQLRAGIDVSYNGDLALKSKWDFVDWRYGNSNTLLSSPGMLTIKASGALVLEKSISDGFKNGSIANLPVNDLMQTDGSWSYQLTAGADLTNADPMATDTANNLTIGSGVTVRTGTGNIALASGGDVVFTDKSSTVYSAGRAEDTNRYGTLSDTEVGFLFYSEYPVDGGNLTIQAGHDIKGAVNNTAFISSWLLRRGNWTNGSSHNLEFPTSWGIALSSPSVPSNAAYGTPSFQQNVGSFGGGKVSISASNNINDLSVMMPTTGKQIGDKDLTKNTLFNYINNKVQIQGGGEMQVTAGGDIAGGAYYLGKGNAQITAGREITGGSQFTNGPQLVMGDSKLALNATNGISISAVSDAMIINNGDTNFFSYTDSSGVSLKSLAGDVHLGADTSVIGGTKILGLEGSQDSLSKVYPASLQATAFSGSVLLDDKVTLFPSATATLNVLAKQNISSTVDSLQLSMSDADRSFLPSAEFAAARNALNAAESVLNPFGVSTIVHANTPIHSDDAEPVRIVTQEGDIASIQLNFPKKAVVQSGRDLSNATVQIQQINDTDVSSISAARDIIYTSNRSSDGSLGGNINKLEIAGPGNVLVKSGRNIDFGASGGLSTIGNTLNENLANSGANLTVLTGLNSSHPDYEGLLNLDPYIVKYAENYTKFQEVITGFMRTRTGNTALTEKTALEQFKALGAADYASIQPQLDALVSTKYTDTFNQITGLITGFVQRYTGDLTITEADALKLFAKMTPNQYISIEPQLNTLNDQLLFSELKETGAASAANPTLGNERGFAAIDLLYPGTDWKGDLSLFFSKIQTLGGGNIDLLVPGGQINAGLAVAFTGSKDASELGIVAQDKGNINAFVRNDFIVNQSRVFALNTGDIMIWSSEGNIDAGRGAKSALAVPPPIISVDKNGNLTIKIPTIVSGSGIRTGAPAGSQPGNVALFAPKGVVNAGEAGIAGTNVTISATAVLGANNIQVGGISSGVPAASTGSLAAGLTGVSNLTASVSQVAQASVDASSNGKDSATNKNMKLGTLSVEIMGYGDGSSGKDENKKKDNPKSSS
ncbi:MAG: filamentous hemagglutinin family protein [Methylovulum sp.]|nr:filamentous hemagglutinin family protein [Methylovulum sp.]